jgi:integrase
MLEGKRDAKRPFEAMSRAIKRLRKAVNEVCNGDEVLNAQRGKATIHSLRDTYASRLVQKNMSLHKVSKLLGHTTPTMTRKYAHLVAEDARQLLNAS